MFLHKMLTRRLSGKATTLLCFICFLCFVLVACKNYHRNKTHADISFSSIKAGEALAIKYCQSCHLLPHPSILDTKSWEKGVLPNMGPRLGIFYYGFEKYPSYKNDKSLDPNFYPKKPLLSFNEWQNIIDYYVATSPDTLPAQNRKRSIERAFHFLLHYCLRLITRVLLHHL